MSKYNRVIYNNDGDSMTVDVYNVLEAWGVTCPALQHLIKKALQPGGRGHKDKMQDLIDIEHSARSAITLEINRDKALNEK